MPLDPQSFAAALRLHRSRLGLTQPAMARLLDVSHEAVSKWERGVSTPAAITQEGALTRLKFARKTNPQPNKDASDAENTAGAGLKAKRMTRDAASSKPKQKTEKDSI